MENKNYNYWIVGASWRGVEHQDEKFVKQGIWMLGWEEGNQPQKASEMKSGDRIAIKRMKGKGQTGIKIYHLGIIKGVILETNKIICTVNWVVTNLNRNIDDSRGCFKSIHGPYNHDSWIEKIFCL